MRTFVFLVACAWGMIIALCAYAAGGVALMTAGFTLSFVIVGCLCVMAFQLDRTVAAEAASETG